MSNANVLTRTDLATLAANGQMKIEKGIPIPPATRGGRGGGGSVSPIIKQMKVGDSIFFKGKKSTGFSWVRRRHRPMVFTVRAMNGGTRMWRIK